MNHALSAKAEVSNDNNIIFWVLLRAQSILLELLSSEEGFIKVDKKVLERLLDNIIMILGRCRREKTVIIATHPSKPRNIENTVVLQNPMSSFGPKKPKPDQVRNMEMQDVLRTNSNKQPLTIEDSFQVFNEPK
jgi:hypothetical protein